MTTGKVEVGICISSSSDDAGVRLSIRDEVSRETLVDVHFTYEQFSRVLMNQVTGDIRAGFGHLHRIAKTPVSEKFMYNSYTNKAAIAAKEQELRAAGWDRVMVAANNRGETTVTATSWGEKP